MHTLMSFEPHLLMHPSLVLTAGPAISACPDKVTSNSHFSLRMKREYTFEAAMRSFLGVRHWLLRYTDKHVFIPKDCLAATPSCLLSLATFPPLGSCDTRWRRMTSLFDMVEELCLGWEISLADSTTESRGG